MPSRFPVRALWNRVIGHDVGRYGIAMLIFLTFLSLRFLLLPVESGLAYLTFFPALAVTALLCGLGPSLLVTVLGGFCGYYYFVLPSAEIKTDRDSIVSFLIFLASGPFIAMMIFKQKQLERGRWLLSAIVRSADSAVISKTMDGIVTSWNPGAERIFGYPADQVIGAPLRQVFSPDASQQEAAFFQTITRGETINGREITCRRRDGSPIDIEVTISPILDESRRTIGMSVIANDITRRKAMELEIKRSNAALEQFSYAVSHDLREPLRMVTSYISLIRKRLGPDVDDDLAEYMQFAIGGAKRMDRLILDLLEYSRIGRGDAVPEAVALGELCAEVVHGLSLGIADAHARITLSSDLPVVTGIRSELARLVQNLLANAIKYRSPDRPAEIAVSARLSAEGWVVMVSDNGIGVPDDKRDEIFGIFKRLHSQAQYEGTGIGLAMCRKIVELHGGRIWVESVEGRSSTFCFTLPDEPTSAGPGRDSAAPSSRRAGPMGRWGASARDEFGAEIDSVAQPHQHKVAFGNIGDSH